VLVAFCTAGCGRNERQAPIVGQARLIFRDLRDGPAPSNFGGGPALVTADPAFDAPSELRVVGGKLTNDPTVPGRAAGYYTSADLGAPVTTIGARWTFTPRGGTPGAMALVVSQTALHPPFSIHLVITPDSWSMGVWPPITGDSPGLQVLDWQRFEVPLRQDGVQIHEAAVEIRGGKADIKLPDGQHRVVTDGRIADWAGSFATFEAYADHGLTDSRVGFTKIWAESRRTS
jgi:hypothetical protein